MKHLFLLFSLSLVNAILIKQEKIKTKLIKLFPTNSTNNNVFKLQSDSEELKQLNWKITTNGCLNSLLQPSISPVTSFIFTPATTTTDNKKLINLYDLYYNFNKLNEFYVITPNTSTNIGFEEINLKTSESSTSILTYSINYIITTTKITIKITSSEIITSLSFSTFEVMKISDGSVISLSHGYLYTFLTSGSNGSQLVEFSYSFNGGIVPKPFNFSCVLSDGSFVYLLQDYVSVLYE